MSFLSNLHSFGQLTPRTPRYVGKTAVERYVENVNSQVHFLNVGMESSWVKEKDGALLCMLRNGNKLLPLEVVDGKPVYEIRVADKDAAVRFLNASIEAAKAGEFDELFKLTAKKPNGSREA